MRDCECRLRSKIPTISVDEPNLVRACWRVEHQRDDAD